MITKQKPSNTGSGRLFKNEFLEKMTHTHAHFAISVFFIVSTGVLIYGLTNNYITGVLAVPLFVAGWFAFTLVEYIMHRFVFHMAPVTKMREKIAYNMHGIHHDYPKDKGRIAMPVPLSLTLSAIFFGFFYLIMGNYTFGFLPGFLFGYGSYLTVHYLIHAMQPPKNFFKYLWVHHGIHHYKDPDHRFGVTIPLWDYVFGTMPKD